MQTKPLVDFAGKSTKRKSYATSHMMPEIGKICTIATLKTPNGNILHHIFYSPQKKRNFSFFRT